MINLSFKKYKAGLQVKTRKGFVWQKVAKDTWLDLSSKLVWLPEESGKFNHYGALRLETNKKRLPTKEEFKIAENHGIREILNMDGKWYWSSSVDPNVTGHACVVDGGNGNIGYGSRSNYDGSVRCVGR